MIRKRLFKITAVVLALLTIFCMGCKSCSNGNPSDEPPTELQKTGEYIVENNQSKYKILIDKYADENERFAAEELQLGIKACVGYTIAITDYYVEGESYLSVGKNEYYEAKKEQLFPNGIKKSEARVVTDGNDVFMVGYSTAFTVYAVYDFMEATFGFKWYTTEDYDVIKADSIALYKFNQSNVADIEFRALFNSHFDGRDEIGISKDVILQRNRRMRVNSLKNDMYMWGHTQGDMILKGKYMAEHPEWFTRNDTYDTGYGQIGQLCLTNEEMRAEMIKIMQNRILDIGIGARDYFMVGANDDWAACTCENCVALSEELYDRADNPNKRSAVEVWFINKIEEEINAWIKTVEPDAEPITIMMFAYFQNAEAPVKTLEDGTVVPVDERAVPNENVMVVYAPFHSDFTYSFDDPRVGTINRDLTNWSTICKGMMVYGYCSSTAAPMYPSNIINTMGGSYRFAKDNSFRGYLEELGGYPSMERLKWYIMSQMWWDTSQSVDELAYEFIDFYYGPVAKEFKEYYAQLKQFIIYQTEVLGKKMEITSMTHSNTVYWPIGMINTFSDMIEDMLLKIEKVKNTDMEAYQKYFDRVNIEKLWVEYCHLFNHRQYLDKQANNEKVNFLLTYMTKYGVCRNLIDGIEGYRIK